MFAGVVHAPFDIRYEEMQTPVPGEHEVRVKVKYTGICGSDVPRVNGNACHFFPNVLGHEFSGTVDMVGSGVTAVKPGDRVAGIPLVPCMECEDCRNGNYSLCKHYSFIGSRQQGSFAEYVTVPERNVFGFDDDVSFLKGALFEPSSVALHGLLCADFCAGKSLIVLGCGMIGLFTIQWGRILGASKIAAVNRSREKLPLAQKMGAELAVSTLDEDCFDRLMQFTDGKGFDYVIDCTGSVASMKESFRLAANKAHVCMVGTPKEEISFTVREWEQMNRKEFVLTGSWMSYSAPFPGKEWTMTAERFHTGDLILDEQMIDSIIPLSRIKDAFERYKTPGGVKGKILIDSEC
ncbi:MAG: galactitol-1-phosphate 5-dehydrogenase [Clostridia bacterium]|nr:galactitol-1-phosphate 5-dehydrogenase [Clostridia bacterium]